MKKYEQFTDREVYVLERVLGSGFIFEDHFYKDIHSTLLDEIREEHRERKNTEADSEC